MKLIRVHLSRAATSPFRSPVPFRFIPFHPIPFPVTTVLAVRLWSVLPCARMTHASSYVEVFLLQCLHRNETDGLLDYW